ncbi:ATP-binding cassette domain-containing protein [Candidatus Persebacteraceae bacterium Df01]|uniref:ATP-binding cassette domain-containing protein n=1 Tax=Candidatus Doriopsillibacter californiensis TaxID=2970740 RepID=A0ABT7QN74_9GAMM|nr:ATP-binding cassette domain-containing protein [Candidatus Persebacteraceae bacterium Df01]
MADIKIAIKSLYKIFGASPEKMVKLVKKDLSKEDLLEKNNHVLGLNNINLNIYERTIHVVMGLSGSGKSTLIRHINRLINPTAGSLIIGDVDILSLDKKQLLKFRRSETAMVFQKFALLPHKTIIENVSFGLQIQGVSISDSHKKAQIWIDRVGLSGFEKHYPQQLSGGMQQRVGLARALCNDAGILLMDEAFSALDPLIRKDMQDMLLQLQSELHKTIVFITHDLDEALRLGDCISILKDGNLVQNDKPEDIIVRPADKYVADFVKDVNRLKVLRAKTIMTNLSNAEESSTSAQRPYRAHEDTNIELFLPHLLSGEYDSVEVVDNDGNIRGHITGKNISLYLSANK